MHRRGPRFSLICLSPTQMMFCLNFNLNISNQGKTGPSAANRDDCGARELGRRRMVRSKQLLFTHFTDEEPEPGSVAETLKVINGLNVLMNNGLSFRSCCDKSPFHLSWTFCCCQAIGVKPTLSPRSHPLGRVGLVDSEPCSYVSMFRGWC